MHKGPNSWHWIRPRRWRDTGEALKSAQSWRLLPSFLNSASLYKLWERASASELTGKQKTIKQRNAFFSQPLQITKYRANLHQTTQYCTYLYEHTYAICILLSSSNCTEKTKPQIGGESASGDLLEQTTRDTFTSTQLTAQLPKREVWNIITDQTASATSHNQAQVQISPLSLTLFPCIGHELYMTRDKRIWRVKSKARV